MDKKNTKRFLVIYCLAIFAFAVALILIASVSQARITREADAIQEKLASAESLAADSKTRLDAVMTENSRLKATIEELTAQSEALKNSSKELEASRKLTELLSLKLSNKTRALKTALAAFENGNFEEFLSEADKQIYNSIK